MSLFEKNIRRLGTFLLAGAFAVSGCSTYISLGQRDDYHHQSSRYTDLGIRAALDIVESTAGLSREKRSVPIHPDDGGPSRGGVMLDMEAGGLTPRLGLELSRGTEDLRLKIGGDMKFDLGNEMESNEKRQNLPPPYESYGYGNVFQEYTFIPFVGLDMNLSDSTNFGFEIGTPFARHVYEIGDYRYGHHTARAKDSYNGFGNSINATLKSELLPGYVIGIVYGIEKYDVRLAGEKTDIDVQSVSLFFRKRH